MTWPQLHKTTNDIFKHAYRKLRITQYATRSPAIITKPNLTNHPTT